MINVQILAEKIKSVFRVVTEASWDWLAAPKGSFKGNLDAHVIYHVQGWILEKPKSII